jgi:hypothetical protein
MRAVEVVSLVCKKLEDVAISRIVMILDYVSWGQGKGADLTLTLRC